jgi:DNA-directed RNA polymerase specialized sigma24 family protein
VGSKRQRRHFRAKVKAWEFELIAQAARKARPPEQDELKAELARQLLQLKQSPVPSRRVCRSLLEKALRNEARNWVRRRQALAKRTVALDQPIAGDADDPLTLEDVLKSPEAAPDLRADFARAWEKLGPELRTAWQMLLEEKGNQIQVARRLGKHRNTIRAWIRRIRQILAAHGFSPPDSSGKANVTFRPDVPSELPNARQRPAAFLIFPSRLLQAFVRLRLNGTQWRMVLWVAREIARRKQRTTPFTWYRIAQELSVDRGAACRAGARLVRAKLLFVQTKRIGLRRDYRQASTDKRDVPADDLRR